MEKCLAITISITLQYDLLRIIFNATENRGKLSLKPNAANAASKCFKILALTRVAI